MQISKPSLAGFEHIHRYWNKKKAAVTAKILPGEYYVTLESELISTVLGSCISACVRDKVLGFGGMNHFMLPETSAQRLHAADEAVVGVATRYGNFAMEHLINTILQQGGKRQNLEVKLFGGGKILPTLSDVGQKNIDFILDYINTEGLSLLAQDLGDIYPRKVLYYPASGKVMMKKLKHIQNETIAQRETQYRSNIKETSVVGDIELF